MAEASHPPRLPQDLTPAAFKAWAGDFVNRAKPGPQDTFMLGLMSGALSSTSETAEALGQMLQDLTLIVKGEPEPGCVWGFEDLPELVQALVDRGKAVH